MEGGEIGLGYEKKSEVKKLRKENKKKKNEVGVGII
jgi:hypothetical protein